MLNREELFQAVDLHERSYNLLLWLSTAISKGIIKFDRAHDYMDESEAAAAWIQGHFLNLPPNCRPDKHEQLKPFAQFFATYLTTSFDLQKRPDKRLKSECGCLCPICAYLVTGSHLKTKKVSRRDKERARKLKITVVQRLSREHGAFFDREQAEKLIDSESNAANVAKLTYGQQLIERARGTSEGPAVLALWREFAWNKSGSPKKDFKLEAEDILRAEETLAKTIAEVA
jgi:hypothetical protein